MKLINKTLNVIGLMSGTSMDGIDTTLVRTDGVYLEKSGNSLIEKYNKKTIINLEKAFLNINEFLKDEARYNELNNYITLDHFEATKKLIKISGITPDVIGFHGQTLFHDPLSKRSIQLGDSQLLTNLLNIPVISHFRQNDMENYGQGAPIAPIYHKFIMNDLKLNLPCCFINIGGIANITFWDGQKLISFDTGPGNVLLDLYMQTVLQKQYDRNGFLSSKGTPNQEFIFNCLQHIYFKKKFPKSLDRNEFNGFLNKIKHYSVNHSDILATLTGFTIASIKKGLNDIGSRPKSIFIVGGGANNKYLVNQLRKNININIKTAREIGLDVNMIEAELIAYLAVRRINNLPITFPGTTGTKQAVIGGVVFEKFL